MKFILTAIATASLSVAAPAQSAEVDPLQVVDETVPVPTVDADDGTAEPDDDGLDMNRRVCKTYKITGSRLAKRRVCRTAMEWKQHEEETKHFTGQALARHAAVPDNEIRAPGGF